VNAAAVSEPLPSDVDRQTKQLFMAPSLSPLAGYNYYLPYGMGMPSAGGFYPFRFASWPYPLGNLYKKSIIINLIVLIHFIIDNAETRC
jgi:hypothetical protein